MATRAGKWGTIPVPSNWQLSRPDLGDIPIYTNVKYPFPATPPHLPSHNPTGVYRKVVKLPEGWKDDSLSVLFHGVSSAFYVYANGSFAGYGQDSCLPSEFDITRASRKSEDGKVAIEVVCVRWSDGSFLEDQDHWWLSGIHRSVEIVRRGKGQEVSELATTCARNENHTRLYLHTRRTFSPTTAIILTPSSQPFSRFASLFLDSGCHHSD